LQIFSAYSNICCQEWGTTRVGTVFDKNNQTIFFVTDKEAKKAKPFELKTFQPSLIFEAKTGAYPSGRRSSLGKILNQKHKNETSLQILDGDKHSSGLYYKHILMIVSDACTINISLVFALALASVVNYARK
jgi:hypothetical protein